MAQLFTVYFPKYHFVLQHEFTITFTLPLPFSYRISNLEILYVEHVHWQDEQFTQQQVDSWKAHGLQSGLTIISINDADLMEYNMDQIDDTTKRKTLAYTIDQIDKMIHNEIDDKNEITLTFREELYPLDDFEPLGLTWQQDYWKQGIYKSQKHQSSQNSQNTHLIRDKQISASSCEQKHEPSQCRLNNSNSCWKPSLSNQQLGNVWIQFDLGMKKVVIKLYIQGNFDHSEYVTSLWIDYSDDGCLYKSHPMKCINIASKYMDCMDVFTQHSKNKCIKSEFKYAVIDIWPSIQAQFIRLRPHDWVGNIAMKVELYGTRIELYQAELADSKVITLDTVNPSDKHMALEALKGIPTDAKVIQVYLKSVVSKALDKAQVRNYGILKADEDNYICTFTTPDGKTSEKAMDRLAEAGIGREVGIVSVTSIEYRSAPKDTEQSYITGDEFTGERFYESIKSRMVVKQVVESVMHGAAFTFDYLLLLLSASLIAVGGLATNSSVIIVASMLVSPLMGPVLAFTFGVTLKQKNMADLGLKNELLSLLICVATGFIVGYFYSVLTVNRNHWPTEEMASRGKMIALADGAFIAAASGIGVALSVLGEYIAAVVGVAISASLLPPAVNCGMLLSFPVYEKTFPQFVHRHDDPVYDESGMICMAVFSFCLTVENVIIIFLVSRLMFAIKNVIMTNDHNSDVWQSVRGYQYSKLKAVSGSSDGVMQQSHVYRESNNFSTGTKTETYTPILSPGNTLFAGEYSVNPKLTHVILEQQSLRFKRTRSGSNSDKKIPMEFNNSNDVLSPFNIDNIGGSITNIKTKSDKICYQQVPIDEQ